MARASRTPLQSEPGRVEARIEVLHGEGAALEHHLGTAVRPREIAELGRRLKSVNDALKQLEDSWLNLSARLDAVGA